MDLELYPREMVYLEDPTGTQWHELHPDKSNFYNLTSWLPSMVLSSCDTVEMEPVEPPGPLELFDVDEVTIDIVVMDEYETLHWLDYKCGYWIFKQDVWTNPVCSKWNEIKPDQGLCWHITSWEDDGDGKLGYCDWIEMTLMYPWGPAVMWCHVEQVTVTLQLESMVDYTRRYLEFTGTLDEFQAMDYIHAPESTMWHEIWPEQGRIWHLAYWYESFMFSPSDKIALTPENVNRFVVMIGDSPAHAAPSGPGVLPGYPAHGYGGDPGRDEIMFTVDDLDYVPVINKVASESIVVFTVDYTYSGDAYTNFEYIADKTGGEHYDGTTAWDVSIASEIATRIGTGRGDVVFTYDITGSMSWYLADVKTKTKAIIDALSTLDVGFGVGTHVDYPDYYDSYGYADAYGAPPDYAWSMDTDITDAATAKSTIDSAIVTGYDGGDTPENYVRVLYECQYFSWRTTGETAEYHVDKLTVAMNLTSTYDEREHIVKFEGSLKEFMKYHWSEPWETQWHEVNPTYCRQWFLADWIDENPDGLLSYCDYILMIDKETGEVEEFHVESLSTDIIVTIVRLGHDVAVTNVVPFKTVVGQGYCTTINVTVENQGDFTETFDVTTYYDTTVIETKTVNNLPSGEETTLTFLWNTTGVAKGNYTITAKATQLPYETDLDDNTHTDGWIIIAMIGDITGPDGWPDGTCNIRDVALVAKAFGANLVTDPTSPKYGEYWHDPPCNTCPHSPNCDITGPPPGLPDGKINIRDVALVASHYGEIDP